MSDVSIEKQAELAITLDDAVDRRIRDTILRVFQNQKDIALESAVASAVDKQVRRAIEAKYKELESELVIRIGMQVGKAMAGLTPADMHKELWEANPYADLIPDESLDSTQVFGKTEVGI
jgi:class 3 adenylate cyclase